MTTPAVAPGRRIPVAVLGATGAVGQTFVRLLATHPWFTLTEVAASARSAGKPYGAATHWLEGPLPAAAARLPVLPCEPAHVTAPLVFSALDATVAGDVEVAFARAGRLVVSNARHHRLAPDVPLLVPEVNPAHLALLPRQRRERGWPGAIVTNANCATTVAVLALAPLHAAFGVERVVLTTLQALSGAGYPGVPALDILGNVIPFIAGGEEAKLETETLKLLGTLGTEPTREPTSAPTSEPASEPTEPAEPARRPVIVPAPIALSAQVTRVPVEHGHTVCLAVGCTQRPTPAQARDVLRAWPGALAGLGLPSAPTPPLVLTEAEDRPQPRRDAAAGGGMAVTVGRVRADAVLDLRLVALGHNTIRGAAGAALLNAELLVARGLLGA